MAKSLVEMTAEIIQSQISSKQMNLDEIKVALNDTFQTLKALQDAESTGTDVEPEGAVPSLILKIHPEEQNHLHGVWTGVQDALPQTSQLPRPRFKELQEKIRSVRATTTLF